MAPGAPWLFFMKEHCDRGADVLSRPYSIRQGLAESRCRQHAACFSTDLGSWLYNEGPKRPRINLLKDPGRSQLMSVCKYFPKVVLYQRCCVGISDITWDGGTLHRYTDMACLPPVRAVKLPKKIMLNYIDEPIHIWTQCAISVAVYRSSIEVFDFKIIHQMHAKFNIQVLI